MEDEKEIGCVDCSFSPVRREYPSKTAINMPCAEAGIQPIASQSNNIPVQSAVSDVHSSRFASRGDPGVAHERQSASGGTVADVGVKSGFSYMDLLSSEESKGRAIWEIPDGDGVEQKEDSKAPELPTSFGSFGSLPDTNGPEYLAVDSLPRNYVEDNHEIAEDLDTLLVDGNPYSIHKEADLDNRHGGFHSLESAFGSLLDNPGGGERQGSDAGRREKLTDNSYNIVQLEDIDMLQEGLTSDTGKNLPYDLTKEFLPENGRGEYHDLEKAIDSLLQEDGREKSELELEDQQANNIVEKDAAHLSRQKWTNLGICAPGRNHFVKAELESGISGKCKGKKYRKQAGDLQPGRARPSSRIRAPPGVHELRVRVAPESQGDEAVLRENLSVEGAGLGIPAVEHTTGRRSVLMRLMDTGVLDEGEELTYVDRKDGRVLLKGFATHDGIRCCCCKKCYALSEFETHAGSTARRPAANIFCSNGRSLAECQNMVGVSSYSVRVGPRGSAFSKEMEVDNSDDLCRVCGDGGELICCDACPSTFHFKCVGIEELPDGDWFCPSCRCTICGGSQFDPEGFSGDTVMLCDQCEREYHVACLQEQGMAQLDHLPEGTWFCNPVCQKIHFELRRLVGKSQALEDNLSFTVLRRTENDCYSPIEAPEQARKLRLALAVMHECFYPIKDSRTQEDLIPHIVNNRQTATGDYRGFYTFLLEQDGDSIAAASVRVFGPHVAEMPLIGTRFQYRRQGMCRRLMVVIEDLVASLGVKKLVLPAVLDVLETWQSAFGFKGVDDAEKRQLAELGIMVFPGASILEKCLQLSEPGHTFSPHGSVQGVETKLGRVVPLLHFQELASPRVTKSKHYQTCLSLRNQALQRSLCKNLEEVEVEVPYCGFPWERINADDLPWMLAYMEVSSPQDGQSKTGKVDITEAHELCTVTGEGEVCKEQYAAPPSKSVADEARSSGMVEDGIFRHSPVIPDSSQSAEFIDSSRGGPVVSVVLESTRELSQLDEEVAKSCEHLSPTVQHILSSMKSSSPVYQPEPELHSGNVVSELREGNEDKEGTAAAGRSQFAVESFEGIPRKSGCEDAAGGSDENQGVAKPRIEAASGVCEEVERLGQGCEASRVDGRSSSQEFSLASAGDLSKNMDLLEDALTTEKAAALERTRKESSKVAHISSPEAPPPVTPAATEGPCQAQQSSSAILPLVTPGLSDVPFNSVNIVPNVEGLSSGGSQGTLAKSCQPLAGDDGLSKLATIQPVVPKLNEVTMDAGGFVDSSLILASSGDPKRGQMIQTHLTTVKLERVEVAESPEHVVSKTAVGEEGLSMAAVAGSKSTGACDGADRTPLIIMEEGIQLPHPEKACLMEENVTERVDVVKSFDIEDAEALVELGDRLVQLRRLFGSDCLAQSVPVEVLSSAEFTAAKDAAKKTHKAERRGVKNRLKGGERISARAQAKRFGHVIKRGASCSTAAGQGLGEISSGLESGTGGLYDSSLGDDWVTDDLGKECQDVMGMGLGGPNANSNPSNSSAQNRIRARGWQLQGGSSSQQGFLSQAEVGLPAVDEDGEAVLPSAENDETDLLENFPGLETRGDPYSIHSGSSLLRVASGETTHFHMLHLPGSFIQTPGGLGDSDLLGPGAIGQPFERSMSLQAPYRKHQQFLARSESAGSRGWGKGEHRGGAAGAFVRKRSVTAQRSSVLALQLNLRGEDCIPSEETINSLEGSSSGKLKKPQGLDIDVYKQKSVVMGTTRSQRQVKASSWVAAAMRELVKDNSRGGPRPGTPAAPSIQDTKPGNISINQLLHAGSGELIVGRHGDGPKRKSSFCNPGNKRGQALGPQDNNPKGGNVFRLKSKKSSSHLAKGGDPAGGGHMSPGFSRKKKGWHKVASPIVDHTATITSTSDALFVDGMDDGKLLRELSDSQAATESGARRHKRLKAVKSSALNMDKNSSLYSGPSMASNGSAPSLALQRPHRTISRKLRQYDGLLAAQHIVHQQQDKLSMHLQLSLPSEGGTASIQKILHQSPSADAVSLGVEEGAQHVGSVLPTSQPLGAGLAGDGPESRTAEGPISRRTRRGRSGVSSEGTEAAELEPLQLKRLKKRKLGGMVNMHTRPQSLQSNASESGVALYEPAVLVEGRWKGVGAATRGEEAAQPGTDRVEGAPSGPRVANKKCLIRVLKDGSGQWKVDRNDGERGKRKGLGINTKKGFFKRSSKGNKSLKESGAVDAAKPLRVKKSKSTQEKRVVAVGKHKPSNTDDNSLAAELSDSDPFDLVPSRLGPLRLPDGRVPAEEKDKVDEATGDLAECDVAPAGEQAEENEGGDNEFQRVDADAQTSPLETGWVQGMGQHFSQGTRYLEHDIRGMYYFEDSVLVYGQRCARTDGPFAIWHDGEAGSEEGIGVEDEEEDMDHAQPSAILEEGTPSEGARLGDLPKGVVYEERVYTRRKASGRRSWLFEDEERAGGLSGEDGHFEVFSSGAVLHKPWQDREPEVAGASKVGADDAWLYTVGMPREMVPTQRKDASTMEAWECMDSAASDEDDRRTVTASERARSSAGYCEASTGAANEGACNLALEKDNVARDSTPDKVDKPGGRTLEPSQSEVNAKESAVQNSNSAVVGTCRESCSTIRQDGLPSHMEAQFTGETDMMAHSQLTPAEIKQQATCADEAHTDSGARMSSITSLRMTRAGASNSKTKAW